MKASLNIWGIKEVDGDGISCPVIPANIPWYKKTVLLFFRFGVCPLCITMSLTYSITTFLRKIFVKHRKEING